MSGIYFTQPGDTFTSIMRKRYRIVDPLKVQSALQSTLSLSVNSNLYINGLHAPIRPYEVIVFPSDFEQKEESPIILPSQFQSITKLKSMPQSEKQVIAELNTEADWQTAEAIAEWAKEYGFLGLSGDANTGSGTAIGMAAQKATPFVDKLNQLDNALVEYRAVANKVGAARQAAKAKVLSLHKQLNQLFGKEIKAILLRKSNVPERSPLINPDRAIHMARSGRRPPNLTRAAGVQSIGTFAKYAKPVGKGLVALDLGFRGWKIYDAHQRNQDWYRELAVQSGGLLGASLVAGAASFVAGLIVLGPFGLVILLLVGAAVAITADYIFQDLGGQFYDYTRTF